MRYAEYSHTIDIETVAKAKGSPRMLLALNRAIAAMC